jgi:uncharacterized protein (DUF488 family)
MATLYTIGHSTHTLREFIAILQAHGIQCVVDVRSIPKSRRVPWFNEGRLERGLQKAKIKYLHFSKLGGLRSTNKQSVNTGWRNASFRGFADYMQTPDFFTGFQQLRRLLKQKKRVAIMCAEALPWRCHRSLIGDAALIRGIRVLDIMSKKSVHPHRLTSFAVINRKKRPIQIVYP